VFLIVILIFALGLVHMMGLRAREAAQAHQAARTAIERLPPRFEAMIAQSASPRRLRVPVRRPEQKLRLMESLLVFLWGRKNIECVSRRQPDASSHWRLVLGDGRSAIDFHLGARHNIYVTDARASSHEQAKLAGHLVLELLQSWADAYDEQVHYAADETVGKWEDVVAHRTMQCARDWLSLF
jgi:hypothetical protein